MTNNWTIFGRQTFWTPLGQHFWLAFDSYRTEYDKCPNLTPLERTLHAETNIGITHSIVNLVRLDSALLANTLMAFIFTIDLTSKVAVLSRI